MINEFAVGNTDYKRKNENSSTINKLKAISNDSVFYFGLFLAAFFILNTIPYASGLLNEFNIGINEVLVSSVGFVNVFFYKVYKMIFSKVN